MMKSISVISLSLLAQHSFAAETSHEQKAIVIEFKGDDNSAEEAFEEVMEGNNFLNFSGVVWGEEKQNKTFCVDFDTLASREEFMDNLCVELEEEKQEAREAEEEKTEGAIEGGEEVDTLMAEPEEENTSLSAGLTHYRVVDSCEGQILEEELLTSTEICKE